MSFVRDKKIKLAGVHRVVGSRQDLTEHPEWSLSLEKVDRGDQPGEMVPGVHVDAPFPPQISHQFAADDAEVESELVPHLLLPLDLERRRADDQDLPGSMPDDEF